jgi:hypothetical protein
VRCRCGQRAITVAAIVDAGYWDGSDLGHEEPTPANHPDDRYPIIKATFGGTSALG